MTTHSVWILEKSNITVSGGGSLDGITQGNGSHLVGRTITLDHPSWLETLIEDNDTNFDDNDPGQRLVPGQTINGVTYSGNPVVEGEYRLTLQDPTTGNTYEVIGFNVNNSSPAYGTVEGLAFVGPASAWPPVGTPLNVISASEGPGYSGQPQLPYADLVTPPCFTPGTLIRTVRGDRPVETLQPGDLIATRDAGMQPLRLLARTEVTPARLAATPSLLPVRIAKGAFGPDKPARTMEVSPQHRLLVKGHAVELYYCTPEALAPAVAFINGTTITQPRRTTPVTYLHLVFDAHHILWSDGIESESFLFGEEMLAAGPPALLGEMHELFDDLRPLAKPARPLLRSWEARLFAA